MMPARHAAHIRTGSGVSFIMPYPGHLHLPFRRPDKDRKTTLANDLQGPDF